MNHASVRVQLRGGLGNQLFQYGAGYALARKHSANLVLDPSLLPVKHSVLGGVSHWPEQISEFDHGGQFLDVRPRAVKSYIVSRVLQFERLVGDYTKFRIGLPGVYASEARRSLEKFQSLSGRRLRLNSYCGSASHFLGYDVEVRDRVRRILQPSSTYLRILAEAEEFRPLGVHIRIGDYSNLPAVYGKFDASYYKAALDHLGDLAGDRPLWIFTDQVDEVKLRLPGIYKRANNPRSLQSLSGLETLNVMSRMASLVCSNSTFSWWASFLAEDPKFQCIFPSPLFALGGPAEPKDFLQPGWLQLVRNFDH